MYQDMDQKYVCAANIINILAAQDFLVYVLVGLILLVYYHSQIFEIYRIKKTYQLVCVTFCPEWRLTDMNMQLLILKCFSYILHTNIQFDDICIVNLHTIFLSYSCHYVFLRQVYIVIIIPRVVKTEKIMKKHIKQKIRH